MGSSRIPLSILDRANNRHTVPGKTSSNQPTELVPESQILGDVITRAQHAESLGYHRFWVAEHHSVPGIAGSVPGILMSAIASATETIRIGSGGIMVPTHMPLVTAEQIATLSALFPGRIDAGLGSSVGFTKAVRQALGQQDDARFNVPEMIADIIAYLDGKHTPTTPVTAYPQDFSRTPVFILASHRSIPLAAQLGAGVVIGGPGITAALANPEADGSSAGPQAIDLYRKNFVPSARNQAPHVMISTNITVAETQQEAEDLMLSEAWAMVESKRIGSFEPLKPPALIRKHLDEGNVSAQQRRRLREYLSHAIYGTADHVVQRLTELVEFTGADEVLVTGAVLNFEHRLASDRALIEAWKD